MNRKVCLANMLICKYDRRKKRHTFLSPARKVSKEQAKGALRANAPLVSASFLDEIRKEQKQSKGVFYD